MFSLTNISLWSRYKIWRLDSRVRWSAAVRGLDQLLRAARLMIGSVWRAPPLSTVLETVAHRRRSAASPFPRRRAPDQVQRIVGKRVSGSRVGAWKWRRCPPLHESRRLRETSLTGRSGRGGGRGGTEPLAFVRHRESSCSASGEVKGFLKLRRATSATSGETSFNLKTHPVTRTHSNTSNESLKHYIDTSVAWNTIDTSICLKNIYSSELFSFLCGTQKNVQTEKKSFSLKVLLDTVDTHFYCMQKKKPHSEHLQKCFVI